MAIPGVTERVVLSVAIILQCACKYPDRSVPPDPPSIASLRLSCTPEEAQLVCRALIESTGESNPESTITDVTDTSTWLASDEAVLVRQGRISGRRAGVATVSATATWSGRPVSADVHLAVEQDRAVPQIVYRLDGAVRDLGNAGLGGAEVLINTKAGQRRTTVKTDRDGSFTASELPAGEYALCVSKAGYRSADKTVSLPSDRPITVALIREPTP